MSGRAKMHSLCSKLLAKLNIIGKHTPLVESCSEEFLPFMPPTTSGSQACASDQLDTHTGSRRATLTTSDNLRAAAVAAAIAAGASERQQTVPSGKRHGRSSHRSLPAVLPLLLDQRQEAQREPRRQRPAATDQSSDGSADARFALHELNVTLDDGVQSGRYSRRRSETKTSAPDQTTQTHSRLASAAETPLSWSHRSRAASNFESIPSNELRPARLDDRKQSDRRRLADWAQPDCGHHGGQPLSSYRGSPPCGTFAVSPPTVRHRRRGPRRHPSDRDQLCLIEFSDDADDERHASTSDLAVTTVDTGCLPLTGTTDAASNTAAATLVGALCSGSFAGREEASQSTVLFATPPIAGSTRGEARLLGAIKGCDDKVALLSRRSDRKTYSATVCTQKDERTLCERRRPLMELRTSQRCTHDQVLSSTLPEQLCSRLSSTTKTASQACTRPQRSIWRCHRNTVSMAGSGSLTTSAALAAAEAAAEAVVDEDQNVPMVRRRVTQNARVVRHASLSHTVTPADLTTKISRKSAAAVRRSIHGIERSELQATAADNCSESPEIQLHHYHYYFHHCHHHYHHYDHQQAESRVSYRSSESGIVETVGGLVSHPEAERKSRPKLRKQHSCRPFLQDCQHKAADSRGLLATQQEHQQKEGYELPTPRGVAAPVTDRCSLIIEPFGCRMEYDKHATRLSGENHVLRSLSCARFACQVHPQEPATPNRRFSQYGSCDPTSEIWSKQAVGSPILTPSRVTDDCSVGSWYNMQHLRRAHSCSVGCRGSQWSPIAANVHQTRLPNWPLESSSLGHVVDSISTHTQHTVREQPVTPVCSIGCPPERPPRSPGIEGSVEPRRHQRCASRATGRSGCRDVCAQEPSKSPKRRSSSVGPNHTTVVNGEAGSAHQPVQPCISRKPTRIPKGPSTSGSQVQQPTAAHLDKVAPRTPPCGLLNRSTSKFAKLGERILTRKGRSAVLGAADVSPIDPAPGKTTLKAVRAKTISLQCVHHHFVHGNS